MMLSELERRFPDLKFTMNADASERDDKAFKLMPILGVADSEYPVLQWPDANIIADVLSCLADFIVQEKASRLH
ncbi:hypothetical protein IG197_16645 [Aminobacter sp. SR38]|jgi:hypothetical protein|uniref:hypothetical protein n=1 Tax=Aminobacter sp. SR38 TaxID=2774562 RepID=UPI00177FB652|nr:hypothetical protein [Aminobacter sp. SR38]QOF69496.1 hypothetical protein IG197_16645 [Aminobacter sp. SR38]